MQQRELKQCGRCGQRKPRKDFYRLTGSQYKDGWDCRDSLCKSCRIEYHSERRRQLRREAIDYLGGECEDCGFKTTVSAVYEFHHEGKKDFNIANRVCKIDKIKAELDKCTLLCANCHRIRHHS